MVPSDDTMDKKEIVQAILKKGILISPDLLDRLNEDTLRSILENRDKTKEIVMGSMPEGAENRQESPKPETEANTITKPEPEADENKITVRVRATELRHRLSPDDFVRHYNNKYGALREILLKKTSAVSVNKAGGSASTVTVIGMVKELTSEGFVLEDPTGEIRIVSSQDKASIAEDDVLAASGVVRGERLFAKDIMMPDVPLTHPIGAINAEILLAEKMREQSTSNPGHELVCLPGKITAGNGNPMELPNPAWIDISRQGKSASLLVYKPEEGIGLSDAVGFLKKRYLPQKKKAAFGKEDPFLIDPVPDVFWLVSGEKGIRAYKGVTIVSCGPNSAASVNLRTREVVFSSL